MDQNELGRLLKKRRRKLRLRVQDVATRAGVSTELWYAVEAGRYPAQVKAETETAMLEAVALRDGEELSEPDVQAQLEQVLEELQSVKRLLAQLLEGQPQVASPPPRRRRSAGGEK